jgi:hypothetical protein
MVAIVVYEVLSISLKQRAWQKSSTGEEEEQRQRKKQTKVTKER